MTEFTPFASLAGGILIGLAAVLLMAGNGWIAGVSGIVSGLMAGRRQGLLVRLAFVGGLIAAPAIYTLVRGEAVAQVVTESAGLAAAAGLLVGFGAVLGSGCTSGHGVCGLSRFSLRSLVATAVFLISGVVTVTIVRHAVGG